MDFYSLGIHVLANRSGDGNIKTFCPKCHPTRHDRHDRSLSVNLRTGQFNYHYCGYKGTAERNTSFGSLRTASSFGPKRPASVKTPDRTYSLPSPASCNTAVTANLVMYSRISLRR